MVSVICNYTYNYVTIVIYRYNYITIAIHYDMMRNQAMVWKMQQKVSACQVIEHCCMLFC